MGWDDPNYDFIARQFDVPIAHIRHDHLISHVLAAIGSEFTTDELIFYGGTALISDPGWQWPTASRPIEQRYSDAPPVEMRTPTIGAFAAMKLTAWLERSTPRDLYDLWALAREGAINTMALKTFVACGLTGQEPSPWMFDQIPDDREWQYQLANQTRLTITATQALVTVRDAWIAAITQPCDGETSSTQTQSSESPAVSLGSTGQIPPAAPIKPPEHSTESNAPTHRQHGTSRHEER